MTAPEVFLGYIMAARKRFWSWDVSSILRSIIHFFFYIYIFIKLKPKIIKRVNLGFFLIYLDISWVIFNQGEQINHCHLLPRSQAWKLRRVNLESTILEAISVRNYGWSCPPQILIIYSFSCTQSTPVFIKPGTIFIIL